MDIRGILNAGWTYAKTIPATLDEMRTGDNLLRISHIAIAQICLNEYQNPSSGYAFSVAKSTYFYAEFLRSFRLPHMWINRVNRDTIEYTNTTVQKIIDELQDPRTVTPSIAGLTPAQIAGLRSDVVALRFKVRTALDTLLAGNKGYTENSFKTALAKLLSDAISRQFNGNPVQVNLDNLQMITPTYSLYKPRTYKDLALLVSRTFHAVFMNAAILQSYGIYDFSNIMDKIGLKQAFTTLNGNQTEPIISALIYTSFAVNFVCNGIIAQMKLEETRNSIQANGGMIQFDYTDRRRYHSWTVYLSISNAVLYTFALTKGMEMKTFFNIVRLIKIGELAGEIAFKYRYERFTL